MPQEVPFFNLYTCDPLRTSASYSIKHALNSHCNIITLILSSRSVLICSVLPTFLTLSEVMARLLILFALCMLPALVSSWRAGDPFYIRGRVYCDTCRCGFETKKTTYIPCTLLFSPYSFCSFLAIHLYNMHYCLLGWLYCEIFMAYGLSDILQMFHFRFSLERLISFFIMEEYVHLNSDH